MKTKFFPVAVALLLAVWVVGAQAQIADSSAHNLSANSTWSFTSANAKASNTNEVCVFCHTPHRTTSAQLLWNRTNPSASNFTMYVPLSGNTGTLGDASLRCLSCHDGVTAFNAVVKNPSTGAPDNSGKMDTTAFPAGTNLTNDHPVGFTVPTTTGWKSTPGSGGFAELYSGKVECASCHDPHTNQAKFLRASNTNSQICKDCHDK